MCKKIIAASARDSEVAASDFRAGWVPHLRQLRHKDRTYVRHLVNFVHRSDIAVRHDDIPRATPGASNCASDRTGCIAVLVVIISAAGQSQWVIGKSPWPRNWASAVHVVTVLAMCLLELLDDMRGDATAV